MHQGWEEGTLRNVVWCDIVWCGVVSLSVFADQSDDQITGEETDE